MDLAGLSAQNLERRAVTHKIFHNKELGAPRGWVSQSGKDFVRGGLLIEGADHSDTLIGRPGRNDHDTSRREKTVRWITRLGDKHAFPACDPVMPMDQRAWCVQSLQPVQESCIPVLQCRREGRVLAGWRRSPAQSTP